MGFKLAQTARSSRNNVRMPENVAHLTENAIRTLWTRNMSWSRVHVDVRFTMPCQLQLNKLAALSLSTDHMVSDLEVPKPMLPVL